MNITEEMLKVAVTKSVEAGLLPRRALKEDFHDAQEMMRAILQSALDSPGPTEKKGITNSASSAPETAYSSRKSEFIPIQLHNCC
jgi:hypothetical protein